MTAYPADFRCAQITPYTIAVDMGLLRTPMEGGNARQRRLYRHMPHAFALEFIMTVQELGSWQEWVNEHGYDYFVIDKLESMYAGKKGVISSPHNIRFTSNLAIDNPIYGWVRVKVSAELGSMADNPALAWIIAGTPALPSAGLPPVSFNLMTGTLPAGSTFARGSMGWYFGMPNSIRNPTFAGGVPGSPGTMPTNMVTSSYGTLTRTLAFGVEDGMNYMDVRLSGTTSNTGVNISLEAVGAIPAATGETFILTDYVSMPAGSMANITVSRQNCIEYTSAPAFIRTANGVPLDLVLVNAPLRTRFNSTLITLGGGATTASIVPNIGFVFPVGVVIDITIRVAMPALATAVLASAGNNVPRWTYDPTTLALLGLLNEPDATNALRNSSGAGANGTATMPTTWGSGGVLNGLVRTFTQVTEDGIPATDIKVSGTPIATGTLNAEFSTRTAGIACAIGQTWTGSLNHRLSAGTLNNVTLLFAIAEYDAGGAVVAGQTSQPLVPTAAPLKSQRVDITKTLAQAPAVTITEYLRFSYTVDQPIDLTVRVYPQLAQIAAVEITSPIVTTAAAVTRAQDVFRVPLEDGTYTLTAQRVEGPTTHVNQSATGGTLRVPVDTSPLQSLVAIKTAPGVFIIAGTPAAPSAGMIEGGTPATWAL